MTEFSPETRPTQFSRKPVVIEAWQWHGESCAEMRGVCQCSTNSVPHVHTAHENSLDDRGQHVFLTDGDWIIPEPSKLGRYYPCKPDVFAATYEPSGLAQSTDVLREALERSVVAIDDWLNTYASDLCDPERVKEAQRRIQENGTLWYIATIQEQNRAALAPGNAGAVEATDIYALHEKMTGHLFPAYSNTDERFLALALCGETGELANYIKKRWRDGADLTDEIRDEIADIRVYLELLAKCFGIEGKKLDRRVEQKLVKVVEKHRARLAGAPLPATQSRPGGID